MISGAKRLPLDCAGRGSGAGVRRREGEVHNGPGVAGATGSPSHRETARQPSTADWPESSRCTFPVSEEKTVIRRKI